MAEDPLDIMLMHRSDTPDEGMQRALASGLRRRREIGELGLMTGDEVLAPFGQRLMNSAQRDIEGERARLEKAAQRQLTKEVVVVPMRHFCLGSIVVSDIARENMLFGQLQDVDLPHIELARLGIEQILRSDGGSIILLGLKRNGQQT